MTCSRQFFTENSEFYPQRENNAHTVYNTCPQITTVYFHELQRAREEIAFTTWPNIWSCTPKLLATAKAYFVCHISSLFQISLISPCFDLCLHWVSVVWTILVNTLCDKIIVQNAEGLTAADVILVLLCYINKKLSLHIQIPNIYLGLGFEFGPQRI